MTVLAHPPLDLYSLPETPEQVPESMKASLRFLDVSAKKVTVPLWSTMYLAPLCDILDPPFVLWVYGCTGCYKSTLAALAMSHFGDFDYQTLPSSASTIHSIMLALEEAKNQPVVIDDFHPSSCRKQEREQERKIDEIVRSVSSRSGSSSRMNSSGRVLPIRKVQAMCLATSESPPKGFSTLVRTFTVKMQREDTDVSRLMNARTERGLYRNAMASYVKWLQTQDHDGIREHHLGVSQRAMEEGLGRFAVPLANLETAAFYALLFASNVHAISLLSLRRILIEIHNTLEQVAAANIQYFEEVLNG